MANNKRIKEFNDIVDTVIQRQEDEQLGEPISADEGKSAKFGELIFSRVGARDGRYSIIGRNVGDMMMRTLTTPLDLDTLALDGKTRRIPAAHLSFRTHDVNSMDRLISVDGYGPLMHSNYDQPISGAADQLTVVRFARSPHLETEAIRRWGALLPDELAHLFEELDRDAESNRLFAADMAELDAAMRMPPGNEIVG